MSVFTKTAGSVMTPLKQSYAKSYAKMGGGQTNNVSIYGCQLISTGNNIIRAIYLNPAATEKLAKSAPVANRFPVTKINLHLSPFLSRLCIHHPFDGLWLQNKSYQFFQVIHSGKP